MRSQRLLVTILCDLQPYPDQAANTSYSHSLWWFGMEGGMVHILQYWLLLITGAVAAVLQVNSVTSATQIDIALHVISYQLIHEYQMVENWYSQLSFTCEDHLCINLHMQEQLTSMISQWQYLVLAWCHRLVMSQCYPLECRNEQLRSVFSGVVHSGYKIAYKKWNNVIKFIDLQ